MGHYLANVRDLEFNLFEVLGVDTILDSGVYGDLDAATAREILGEVAKLAEGPVADSFTDSDRNPPRFDAGSHSVEVPEPMRATVRAVRDAQWWRLGLTPELGGQPAPAPLLWALREMLVTANPSASFFTHGPILAGIVHRLGTDEQKRWAAAGLERGWGTTMVLTEPDVGSDVGAGRTRALPQPDGTWHLEGVKRFISVGDVGDLTENIFHLVLARPAGAGPGTKGLSLFYVPKFLFDPETFEPRSRNGVFVTGMEHKMGLRGSPTCELTFGGTDVPAVGYLVGGVHDGIAQMFQVIEYARMSVGVKATGTLSTAYLHALAYAKTREQGPDLTRAADNTAPRVPIIRHPDVRRGLLSQKAYAEGLRALYFYAAVHKYDDVAELVPGVDAELAGRVNDLLLPVVKAVTAERTYEMLTESLQTFGGSGYLQDYPIEQYIRDSKGDSVYEGTSAIQALDFFFRKILRDKGIAFNHLIARIDEFATGHDPDRIRLREALADVRAMATAMTGYALAAQQDPAQIYKVGLVSVRFLYAFGDLLIAWRLLVQAERARQVLEAAADARDIPFYQGKIAAAGFFAATVLPRLAADRRIVETVDGAVMELADEAL
ncbi:acyl-CoA dehydrogenase [Nocardia inohanensis]|uniref:acyl-CoA dehydrogenase n=1 Tax=Nocardia inohanensis TaxID=209246 RepID=UPI0008360296|nr:acyl-CoA dehydrogenase [Nocardia inohanensis]